MVDAQTSSPRTHRRRAADIGISFAIAPGRSGPHLTNSTSLGRHCVVKNGDGQGDERPVGGETAEQP
jgi:hypothetical protein